MRPGLNYLISLIILFVSVFQTPVQAQNIDNYKYLGSRASENIVHNENKFNGYTNYWHDTYSDLYRYGNLFKMAVPNIEKTILQSKVDIAEEIGIPGLVMQEGFINALLSTDYSSLNQPSIDDLEHLTNNGNILVYVDPDSKTGKKLNAFLLQENKWYDKIKSHQFGAKNFVRVNAFWLEYENKKIFVVSSINEGLRNKVKAQINNTKEIVAKYDFHKGWFGAATLLNSVTCTKGHPLEVIGEGMNEGCSWFVFEGYMDFLSKNNIADWVKEVNLPIVTDVGASQVYGCNNYNGFQIQQMYSHENWIDFARDKNGYIFRAVWDTLADPYHYDGYIATEGNKEQIDNENVPFVLKTGMLDGNTLSSMVLFLEKDKQLTRENMWKAIFDRREVGVLGQGKMMGPVHFRNALQILLLDRVFLENYFGDHINLKATTEGYDLQVTITNTSKISVNGILDLVLPTEINIKEHFSISIKLPAGSSITKHFTIEPKANAMDNANPITVHFNWDEKMKSTLTMLDLPPAISVHRLLYAHTPKVSYPVTIHNFTNKSSFPVIIQVINTEDKKAVFQTSQICTAPTSRFQDLHFELDLPAGNYKVKVSALGVDYFSQLGVGKATGAPYVYETDLNGDGINEYRMENDSVQITLLTTGARVIEYIVKSRHDNILFKLWPKKAIDDKRSFRKKEYYPYGGFEDFLGQASMETHQVYDAKIVKNEGDFVRVKMWTDYYGNKIEKTFTLYGNSPLLEIRFALDFKNPEANMLGPQPMLSIGANHWTEDKFIIPEMNGLQEMRMKPEKYFGQAFAIKEGWNAGYDTKEDITFVGAFPVDQPLFLHMWMNHPSNPGSHYYYAEFQPWVPIQQKTTMYFSYYLWGAGGPWENGVKALREMNLITTR